MLSCILAHMCNETHFHHTFSTLVTSLAQILLYACDTTLDPRLPPNSMVGYESPPARLNLFVSSSRCSSSSPAKLQLVNTRRPPEKASDQSMGGREGGKGGREGGMTMRVREHKGFMA